MNNIDNINLFYDMYNKKTLMCLYFIIIIIIISKIE